MPTNKKIKPPIITTDRRKVQAYNDSSFIKKNFNIFPHPKGYGEALKRVGQDPSADYFPAPEQPYILKKEKKKIKKDIVPVPVKESIPKDTIPVVKPIIKPIVKPQVEKEPEPIVPKKLPGGSGPFARYPNMKKQLGNLKTSRMVNARKVENIVPTFVSGAKSVKQYRGDENLPEAKNGMKNCGCKHPKSKYKYGTGAVVIPENSAIVTAKNGAGRKAVEAHLRGDDQEVEKLINRMPEDRPTGKKYKYKNDVGNKKLKSSSALNYVPANQHKDKYYGKITDADFNKLRENNPWYDWSNFDPSREGDVKKFQEAFNKLSESLGSKARLEVDDKLGEQTATAKVDYMGEVPEEKITDKSNTEIIDDKKKPEFKMNKGFDIPSLAEVSAKGSILNQGIEGVPENYLKLGRYNYASQLPKTLREIQLAEQAGRETARDVVAGDAGRYLAQSGALSSARMKANNDAIVQDTLERQKKLDENINLGNREAEANLGLKNQYIQQRAANRGAYNNMLVSLGQSVDTATDASKLMANQRGADNQRLAMLKSMTESGNYDITTNPDGTMSYSVKKTAKGVKKLKTYKRK